MAKTKSIASDPKKKKKNRRSSNITVATVTSYVVPKHKVRKISNSIAEEIVEARIAIAHHVADRKTYEKIDAIMCQLQKIAPKMATEHLKYVDNYRVER